MSVQEFLRCSGILSGIAEFEQTENALLLDVRTPQEYREGHIPGSKNLPLQAIENAFSLVKNKEAKLFVYCHCGERSGEAAQALRSMGYANVKNIGGIAVYGGALAR